MIKEKARDLAAAIKESPEFQKVQSARARVKLDPTAQDLLQRLQQAQENIILSQQQGKPMGPDALNELRTLESQMQLNLTLKNLVDAQQEFDQVMEEVNQILVEVLR